MTDNERFIHIGELWSRERGTDEWFASLEYDAVENSFVINEYHSPGMYAQHPPSSHRIPAESDIGQGKAYQTKAAELIEGYLASNPTAVLREKIEAALAKVMAL